MNGRLIVVAILISFCVGFYVGFALGKLSNYSSSVGGRWPTSRYKDLIRSL